MGLTYADLIVKSWGFNRTLPVRALVDTGALKMCLTAEQAQALGFDLSEMRQERVTLGDGSKRLVPVVAPITLEFENRQCVTEAFVLGDEALMGCIPLEAMDLVIQPSSNRVVVNPAHPDFPVFHAK